MEMGQRISHQRIYRVTHPNMIHSSKQIIELLLEKPSITAKKIAHYQKDGDSKIIRESETSEFK